MYAVRCADALASIILTHAIVRNDLSVILKQAICSRSTNLKTHGKSGKQTKRSAKNR